MSEINMYDFLVIGAGPAGSIFAKQMAENGYSVAIIDARKELNRKVCGEFLCPKGYDLIRQITFKQDVLAGFHSITGMKLYSPAGIEVDTLFPKINTITQTGIAVQRDRFDTRLLHEAITAGASVYMDNRLQSINRIDGNWQAVTNQGLKLVGKYLIGADGRNSFVAKKLNASSKLPNHRVAIHCHISTQQIMLRQGEMHIFRDGTYIGINPTNDFELNFSIVCDGRIVKKLGGAEATLMHYIRQSKNLSSRFSKQLEKTKIQAVSNFQHKTKFVSGKDFALLGDAAGFLDPLTGEGMYNAIWMAYSLSKLIASGTSIEVAFSKYAKLHKRHFWQKSRLNTIFQTIIRQPNVCNLIAKFLQRDKKQGDIFIGVVGNIYTPTEGFLKLFEQNKKRAA